MLQARLQKPLIQSNQFGKPRSMSATKSANMSHTRSFTSIVVLALLCAGCSWFSWLPWVDGDDDKKKKDEPAELVKFDQEIELKRQWRGRIGEGLGKKYLRLSPAVVADRIIAADGYGVVEARDRFSGKRIWRAQTDKLEGGFFSSFNFIDRKDPSFIGGGVGVGDGLVLIGTTEGHIVALNVDDGALAWRTDLGSEILAVSSTGGGLVYTQTIDGRLVALDREDGEVTWTYDNQVPILTLRGTSSPVYASGVVYAGFANGKLSAFRSSNGEPIWDHRVMLPEGRSELDRMVDVDTVPMLLGGTIYIGSYHGRVKALSAQNGRPLWEREVSTHLDLAEGYGQIYAVDDEDIITAIDQASGEVVWTQDDFRLRKLSSPLAFSNYLLVGDDEGYLHVIAQRDGRHLGRRKIDGKGIRSNMLVADGTVFVLDNAGGLHALEVETK